VDTKKADRKTDMHESDTFRPFRKVYATVKSETFRAFADRCRYEKTPIDEALAGLVKLYADGGNIIKPKHHDMKAVQNLSAHYLPTVEEIEEDSKS